MSLFLCFTIGTKTYRHLTLLYLDSALYQLSSTHVAAMAWKSFLLNGFLSIMDMKQHIMMGTEMANCCDDKYYKSARSLDTGHDNVKYYSNPVIRSNAPDPSVVRLVDGSGWLTVTTSDHSSRYDSDPRAFPLYYSRDLINWELRWGMTISAPNLFIKFCIFSVHGCFTGRIGQDGLRTICGHLSYIMSMAGWLQLQ